MRLSPIGALAGVLLAIAGCAGSDRSHDKVEAEAPARWDDRDALRSHVCAKLLDRADSPARLRPFGLPSSQEAISHSMTTLCMGVDAAASRPAALDGGLEDHLDRRAGAQRRPLIIIGEEHNEWQSAWCTGRVLSWFNARYGSRGILIMEAINASGAKQWNAAHTAAPGTLPRFDAWLFCEHRQQHHLLMASTAEVRAVDYETPPGFPHIGNPFAQHALQRDEAFRRALVSAAREDRPVALVCGLNHVPYLMLSAIGAGAVPVITPGPYWPLATAPDAAGMQCAVAGKENVILLNAPAEGAPPKR